MADIICIGEMLIDFICKDIDADLVHGANFEKKAGGAPANVAVGCSKLGIKTGFIGKVGSDPFGVFLRDTIKNEGVETSGVILETKAKTSLAFVSIKADGERDFIFFREPGADTLLKIIEIDKDYLLSAKIFHFGSISLIGGEIKKTVINCLKLMKKRKKFISFDPNIRFNLWKSKDDILKGINLGLPYADVIKVADSELKFITGFSDYEKGIHALHNSGPKIVVVTLGKDGAIISNGIDIEELPGYQVKAVDTTGAGDGFMAGMLYQICRFKNIESDSKNMENLKKAVDFANKTAAIVTTKFGAIAAMPSLKEIENFKI